MTPFEGLAQALVRAGQTRPDEIYCHFEGDALHFGQLLEMATKIARFLADENVSSCDRVAVMMPNSRTSLALIFGLAVGGLVWVPVNTRQRGDGLRYILEHSQPALVMVDDSLLATVEDALPDGMRCIPASHIDQALSGSDRRTVDSTAFAAPPTPEQIFAIMYTSGTTGPPKGVQVTHQMLHICSEGTLLVSDVRDGDVMLTWEPIFHIGGAQLLMVPMLKQVTLAFVSHFSASQFWTQAKRYGATHIHYLGGILQMLLKQPETNLDRTHGVRIAWGGGCPPEIWNEVIDRFNLSIRECYGMTECSSITTVNDDGTIGSVGHAVPWFQLDICDENGISLPRGMTGEIVVSTNRPGAIFPSYFQNPEATARAIRQERMHTGDFGSLDDSGRLRFLGRMADKIRYRGENISAWEIEHVAAKHPEIEDCAVIGVTADIGDEDIKLFIKLVPHSRATEIEISRWLQGRLPDYQWPRYISLVGDFERTPSQRIMKHKLSRDLHGCWDRTSCDQQSIPEG